MKREIKFRAWVASENKIFDFDLINALTGDIYLTDYDNIMQYTGLKDKNGKEIYEGDWCRAEYRTREGIITVQGNIVFDEFMWCVDCKNDIFSINRLHNFEVIGNIYENPELLGKEVTK